MFTLPSTHRQARDLGRGVKCAQGGRKKASVEVKVESSACQLCYDLVSGAGRTHGYTFDIPFSQPPRSPSITLRGIIKIGCTG